MNILQNRLRQAEFNRTVWAAQPEPGVTLDDMVKPEYWAHVSKSLKVGDRIEVVSADGAWFAELFVRSTSGVAANVAVLRQHIFSDAKPMGVPADVVIKHRGDAGWSVIRKSDKQILFEKGATREDAESFARGNNLA